MSDRNIRERIESAIKAVMVANMAARGVTPSENDGYTVHKPKNISVKIDINDGVVLTIDFPVTGPMDAKAPSFGESVFLHDGVRSPPDAQQT